MTALLMQQQQQQQELPFAQEKGKYQRWMTTD
jgi:hypothetical protein